MTRATTASYPLADITRNINQEYYNVNRLIWECADDWHYDDKNATDYPTATITFTHAIQAYSIPSTAQRIRRVEVKDENGNWIKVNPFIEEDLSISKREFLDEPGLPQFYDLVGNYIEFYPAPSSAYATLSSGCAISLDRNITEFTTASTTASPGFSDPFHRILSLQAAIDFGEDNQKIQLWMSEKSYLVDGLKKFYGGRSLEEKGTIRPSGKRRWRQYL
jgi:hypothetical protein